MPTRKRRLEALIEAYLSDLAVSGRLQERWMRKYRSIIKQATEDLEANGYDAMPAKVSREAINHLRTKTWAHVSPLWNRRMVAIYGRFLNYYGNSVVEKMNIPWPQDERIHVDWLTPEETVRMLQAARGVERILVHLELRLGLRRSEVIRLRKRDIKDGVIHVLGKGRGGGKWRTIAWAPDTPIELAYYLSLREEMVRRARQFDPNAEDPEWLFVYQKGKRLDRYKETALDEMVKRVAQRAGISRPVSNHTLRRTAGRNQHYAGVPIEEISAQFGHADVRMTMRYLGLRIEDLTRAQEKTSMFLEEVRKRMEASAGAVTQNTQKITPAH